MNIWILGIMFSNILNLHSYFNVKDHVSQTFSSLQLGHARAHTQILFVDELQ